MKATYTISELAQEFGVTTRTIRHYEDQGLLAPARHGVVRVFSARDRVRLKLALRGKRLGFGLNEIRELFDLYDISMRIGSLGTRRIGMDFITGFRAVDARVGRTHSERTEAGLRETGGRLGPESDLLFDRLAHVRLSIPGPRIHGGERVKPRA